MMVESTENNTLATIATAASAEECCMMPERIKLSRAKGWRMPPNTMKVDRSTKWGNPFRAGCATLGRIALDNASAVVLFSDMLNDPELRQEVGYPNDLTPLSGKNLACWCRHDQPCHADILLELANKPTNRPLIG